MLRHLAIRDFAVVSAAELDLDGGLTVVSGETGAGKSLLVDALLALAGARADAGVVRHGAARAELSAQFSLADAPAALDWLREQELDDGEDCQLRRVIRADGGSKAWINGRAATSSQLAALSARLLEVHGQHEHQALLDRAQQLELLDGFGRHAAARDSVAALARSWSAVDRELRALPRAGDAGERLDWLEHQLAELEAEALEPAQWDALLANHRRQAHAVSLVESYDRALARLAGEDGPSAARGLRQAAADLARHVEHESRLAGVGELLESAAIQADEAVTELERLRDDLDTDPAELDRLDRRLGRLQDLARKHRVPVESLGGHAQQLRDERESLRGAGARAGRLQAEADALAAQWRDAAVALGAARHAAAAALGGAVTGLLAELGMGGGVFAVALEPLSADTPSPQGAERCEFLVSANPGQPPRALRRVASGGELARISLAIEVAAIGADAVPTMIFDEVDTGIGGAVADVVGQKLRALGAQRQVLCVTHLPQVAAQGHHHFQVAKGLRDAHAHSAVARLDDKARVEELARMLGGVEVSRESRANARQMLARARG
jgi:DNA repair protein RecN (Recombination protein N)